MTGPFSRSALIAVVGVAVASLLATVALTILAADPGVEASPGANAYSTSAIGHRGLVALLERLGIPVVVSRSASAERAAAGLLIVAEPDAHSDEARGAIRALVGSAPRTLVVLPKWIGRAAPGARWIDGARAVPPDEVAQVAEAIGRRVEVRRSPSPVAWGPTSPRAVLAAPQLIATDELSAIAFDTAGHQLLGREDRAGHQIHVLADPDVLNNAGLRHAENARFVVDLIDDLRHGGPVVIDETLHGYAQPPSLLRVLLEFPLVLATLQVLACALLVVWAAMVRFGPRRAAPPPIAPGKDFLIRNTAALLQYGGHHAHALERYLQLAVAEVRHALHAPALAPDEQAAWLERVRAARGVRISLVELERAVEAAASPARVVELADQVYRWRTEMIHGTDSRS